MKKTNKKGFTLVELVIVIAVIAILAAVLIPTFSNVIDKANKSADIQAAKNTWTEWCIDAETDKIGDAVSGNYVFVGKNYAIEIKEQKVQDIVDTNKSATILSSKKFGDVNIKEYGYKPEAKADADNTETFYAPVKSGSNLYIKQTVTTPKTTTEP